MSAWSRWTSSPDLTNLIGRKPRSRGLDYRHGACTQCGRESFLPMPGACGIASFAMSAVILVGMIGCGATHDTLGSTTMHVVHIQQEVSPRILYARRGDVIMWHN